MVVSGLSRLYLHLLGMISCEGTRETETETETETVPHARRCEAPALSQNPRVFSAVQRTLGEKIMSKSSKPQNKPQNKPVVPLVKGLDTLSKAERHVKAMETARAMTRLFTAALPAKPSRTMYLGLTKNTDGAYTKPVACSGSRAVLVDRAAVGKIEHVSLTSADEKAVLVSWLVGADEDAIGAAYCVPSTRTVRGTDDKVAGFFMSVPPDAWFPIVVKAWKRPTKVTLLQRTVKRLSSELSRALDSKGYGPVATCLVDIAAHQEAGMLGDNFAGVENLELFVDGTENLNE